MKVLHSILREIQLVHLIIAVQYYVIKRWYKVFVFTLGSSYDYVLLCFFFLSLFKIFSYHLFISYVVLNYN